MTTRHHHIPSGLPQKLDLHVPPTGRSAAEGYAELLRLLEDLGARLNQGPVSKGELRVWEHAVIAHLHDREIDRLMRVPDEAAFENLALPEERWRNLRAILLARKGLNQNAC
ncbi:hypothetical protein [Nitratireductor sp. GCM10026969]|uniref:hypothetical protein n=1 Tax=Nitratireductor sp. GCM10026969 TaxID=3252645 RepID=UPI003611C23B